MSAVRRTATLGAPLQAIGPTELSRLRVALNGAVLCPGEAGCAPARAAAVWNGDIRRQSARAADRSWARDLHAALAPHAMPGTYVNFLGDDGEDRLREAYGPAKYARLAAIKARWDPDYPASVSVSAPARDGAGCSCGNTYRRNAHHRNTMPSRVPRICALAKSAISWVTRLTSGTCRPSP
jgi:hypothetical protein